MALFSSQPNDKRTTSHRSRSELRFEFLEPRVLMAANFLHGLDPVTTSPVIQAAMIDGEFDPDLPDGLPDAPPQPPPAPTLIVPVLNSLAPEQHTADTATIYLDFDGHYHSGTWFDTFPLWPGLGEKSNISTPVFDTDGDPTIFSAAEQDAITRVWGVVAEDFSPFNINVTTVVPEEGIKNGESLRISIGGDGNWLGQGAAGVAPGLDAFSNDSPNLVFVFSEVHEAMWGANSVLMATEIGATASHEAGHAFGLKHQSLFFANMLLEEYHPGEDDRLYIMGGGNGSPSVWNEGTVYTGPSGFGDSYVIQDDLAVLASNDFGYRADDYGFVGDSNTVELELGENINALVASGVIEQVGDYDVFAFETTSSGPVDVRVVGSQYDGNLRPKLRLFSANGTLIGTHDPGTFGTDAVVNEELAAGRYYVEVSSHGAYSDVGQYAVEVREQHGPRVVDSQLKWLSATQAQVTLTFNKIVLQDSLQNSLQVFTGDLFINELQTYGYQTADNITYTFRFDRVSDPHSLDFLEQFRLNVYATLKDRFLNGIDQNGDGNSGDGFYRIFTTPQIEVQDPGTSDPEPWGVKLPGGSNTTLPGTSGLKLPTVQIPELSTSGIQDRQGDSSYSSRQLEPTSNRDDGSTGDERDANLNTLDHVFATMSDWL